MTGTDLREQRIAAGFQQQEIANAMGIAPSAVAQIERRDSVREDTSARYCEAITRCARARTAKELDNVIGLLSTVRDDLVAPLVGPAARSSR